MAYTNNPVLLSIPYSDHNDTTNNKTVSFHMVVVNVTATCSGTSISHEFSSPCANTGSGNVTFDIHTCLQAAAEDYAWSPTATGAGPTVSYSYKYHEEYLLDGESVSTSAVSGTSDSVYVGGLTDFERTAGVSSANTSKPVTSSPQVAASDEEVIIGGEVVGSTSADSRVYRMSDTLADFPDRYLLRFVNRYGRLESIGVTAFRETEMNVTQGEYTISRPDYLSSSIRRHRITKADDYETWKLSSGPLDQEWQQWFAHELLLAENCWLYVNSTWQRVHIIPEDTVTLINRSDASILTVQFSVRFDLNGSPV